jgi:hypothetical protein
MLKAIHPTRQIVTKIQESQPWLNLGQPFTPRRGGDNVNMGVLLQRASLILGLLSLVFALLSGIHLQHILSDGGGRHPGEFAVLIVLALLVFAGCWSGARSHSRS